MRALASSKHVSFVTCISCGAVLYHRSSETVAKESHINRATQTTLKGVLGRPNTSVKEVWSSPEGYPQVLKGGSVPKSGTFTAMTLLSIIWGVHTP